MFFSSLLIREQVIRLGLAFIESSPIYARHHLDIPARDLEFEPCHFLGLLQQRRKDEGVSEKEKKKSQWKRFRMEKEFHYAGAQIPPTF